jgi:hypothetical protein
LGCHTWFYRKVERTYEEARDIWLNWNQRNIKRWEEITHDPEDEFRKFYELSQEECDHTLAVLKRKQRIVEKGLCRRAIFKNQPDDLEGKLYKLVGENLYCTNDDLPGNIFRVGNYPEDKLFSMEDTARFCREKNIELTREQLLRLNIFWEAHPDGMICFG